MCIRDRPYTIEYKIKDKTTTIESNGLEPKLHEVISQQKRYANFKARSRFNKKDCKMCIRDRNNCF